MKPLHETNQKKKDVTNTTVIIAQFMFNISTTLLLKQVNLCVYFETLKSSIKSITLTQVTQLSHPEAEEHFLSENLSDPL